MPRSCGWKSCEFCFENLLPNSFHTSAFIAMQDLSPPAELQNIKHILRNTTISMFSFGTFSSFLAQCGKVQRSPSLTCLRKPLSFVAYLCNRCMRSLLFCCWRSCHAFGISTIYCLDRTRAEPELRKGDLGIVHRYKEPVEALQIGGGIIHLDGRFFCSIQMYYFSTNQWNLNNFLFSVWEHSSDLPKTRKTVLHHPTQQHLSQKTSSSWAPAPRAKMLSTPQNTNKMKVLATFSGAEELPPTKKRNFA